MSVVVILTQITRKLHLVFKLLVPPNIISVLVIIISIFVLIPTLMIFFPFFLFLPSYWFPFGFDVCVESMLVDWVG